MEHDGELRKKDDELNGLMEKAANLEEEYRLHLEMHSKRESEWKAAQKDKSRQIESLEKELAGLKEMELEKENSMNREINSLRQELARKELDSAVRLEKLSNENKNLRQKADLKAQSESTGILGMKAEIQALKLRLLNQSAELSAESGKIVAKENENFLKLTNKLRAEWLEETEKKLEEQRLASRKELEEKDAEAAKLQEEITRLNGQITYEHLPWETKLKSLEEENKLLKIQMKKELSDKLAEMEQENKTFRDSLAKQKEGIASEYEKRLEEKRLAQEKTLNEKENEIKKLREQVSALENQVTKENAPWETRAKFLEDENRFIKLRMDELVADRTKKLIEDKESEARQSKAEKEEALKKHENIREEISRIKKETENEINGLKSYVLEMRHMVRKKDEGYDFFLDLMCRGLTHRLRNYNAIAASAIQSCRAFIESTKKSKPARGKLGIKQKDTGMDLYGDIEKNCAVLSQVSSDIAKLTEELCKLTALPGFILAGASITKVLDKINSDMESRYRDSKVELNIDYANEIPDAEIDAGFLEEALSNIVNNAVEAMPEGGKLTIKAGLDKSRNNLLIKVVDTGHGIPERYLNKIFMPFFSTRKEKKGTGLTRARRIIEAHHGSIAIESRKDKGTEVAVILPLAKEK